MLSWIGSHRQSQQIANRYYFNGRLDACNGWLDSNENY